MKQDEEQVADEGVSSGKETWRILGSVVQETQTVTPTTHLDALMITSIAMVKYSGEMVHPAIIPTSKHCHAVLNFGVEKLNCKSPKIGFH